ncbi:chaperone [Blastocystis sp. subtype 4]|uniref:chaperone n=1 Tax=Blastocystis sp. subtype 4 TaxID=944170 RepID=UPI0007119E87|nr:chaperone [Blastocystis sp. subtype 4]KNB42452.1 chaperone [Blastocystis sp. subtype 4]|eukprot:XP_014525895.1 chaperone [Blastocystis sp. subtype 4]
MNTELSSVGIDLGTTNSEIYKYVDKHPVAIVGPTGKHLTESKIAVDPKSIDAPIFLSGPKLRNVRTKCPENVIYEPKRIIGRSYDDEYVKRDLHFWPFQIVKGDDGLPYYHVSGQDGRTFDLSAVDVDAEILKVLKGYVKEGVTDAVITIPSYFSGAQTAATAEAGKQAGLNVMRCLPEPVAAAIAYGHARKVDNEIVLVYDLGGGTFDCCIVVIENGKYSVLTSDGHSHLGGADFDNAIVKVVADELKEDNIDIYDNKKDLSKLKDLAEKAKIDLSDSLAHNMVFKITDPVTKSIKEYSHQFTRAEFESLIKTHIDRTIEYIQRALDKAVLQIGNINQVILVGGSTRIPYVQTRLSEFFGRPIDPTIVNLDEAVAEGAAIYAASLKEGIELCPSTDPNKIDPQEIFTSRDGDPIPSSPYTLFYTCGNGYYRILEKGKVWGRLKDGSRGFRLNRYACPSIDYLSKVTIDIYAQNDATMMLMGRISIDIPEPCLAEKCRLGLTITYSDRGRLTVILTDVASGNKESTSFLCRGDALDECSELKQLRMRNDMEKKVDILMKKLLRLGNSEKAISLRQRLLEEVDWLENEAVYCDEVDIEEHVAVFQDIEAVSLENKESQVNAPVTVRLANLSSRKNRRPKCASSSSISDSLRSSHVKHTAEEEKIFAPTERVDPSVRQSIKVIAPETANEVTLDDATNIIRKYP